MVKLLFFSALIGVAIFTKSHPRMSNEGTVGIDLKNDAKSVLFLGISPLQIAFHEKHGRFARTLVELGFELEKYQSKMRKQVHAYYASTCEMPFEATEILWPNILGDPSTKSAIGDVIKAESTNICRDNVLGHYAIAAGQIMSGPEAPIGAWGLFKRAKGETDFELRSGFYPFLKRLFGT